MTSTRAEFDALTQPLEGFHAIEASAGTGKTYSSTLLWLRLLLERRLRVDQILVTTFTRAATGELQERLLASLRRALLSAKNATAHRDEAEARIVSRLRDRLGQHSVVEQIEAALSSFDLAPVQTIHGFCQSLISRHSLELGCDPALELTGDASEMLAELVNDELMLRAEQELIDPEAALQATLAVASNPLARILEPIDISEAKERIRLLVEPFLRRVEQMSLPEKSRVSILGKLRAARDGNPRQPLSGTPRDLLSPILTAVANAKDPAHARNRAMRAATLHPIATKGREQFMQRKLHARIRTFDDVLLTVHRALQAHEPHPGGLPQAIQQRLRAAIVDECQDSDSVQISVFKKLFATAESFLVIGDPKQSIYRFRGADLSSYRSLAAEARKAAAMGTNYRSDLPLVEALNRVYRARPAFRGGKPDDPICYLEVTAAIQTGRIDDAEVTEPLLVLWSDRVDRLSAKRDLAHQTALEFRRLLDQRVTIVDGPNGERRSVRASDLAVLATSHGDLKILRRALQAQGIPCEQAGTSLGSIWKSDEALDGLAWLTAVAAIEHHADPLTALLSVAATPLLGLSATEIAELAASPARQSTLAQRLHAEGVALRFQGPLPLLQRYWTDVENITHQLRYRDGERRVTNWRQVGCLLQQEWSRGRWLASDLALWLSRKRGQPADDGEETLMRLETDMPAVQLVTVFAAKGLEYPIVSCPFLWHVPSRKTRLDASVAIVRQEETLLDIGSDRFCEHLDRAIAQEDEEQQRLLYVALTRARHRVYLGLAPVSSYGTHQNGAESSALVELLGLAGFDKNTWPERIPIPIVTPLARPARPSQQASLADSTIRLAPMPSTPRLPVPLTRCTSYSALIRSEVDVPKDYDPDETAMRTRDLGLFAHLNLTGNRLGQRMHRLLEDVIGNGRELDAVTEHLSPEWKSALTTVFDTPIALGSEVTTLAQVRSRARTARSLHEVRSSFSPCAGGRP